MSKDEVFNKIEMKFEQSMLILEDQDPKQIIQDLFEVKVFNVYKKMIKALGRIRDEIIDKKDINSMQNLVKIMSSFKVE